MEEDFQNHSPTVMFRGTPCTWQIKTTLHIFSSHLSLLDVVSIGLLSNDQLE